MLFLTFVFCFVHAVLNIDLYLSVKRNREEINIWPMFLSDSAALVSYCVGALQGRRANKTQLNTEDGSAAYST